MAREWISTGRPARSSREGAFLPGRYEAERYEHRRMTARGSMFISELPHMTPYREKRGCGAPCACLASRACVCGWVPGQEGTQVKIETDARFGARFVQNYAPKCVAWDRIWAHLGLVLVPPWCCTHSVWLVYWCEFWHCTAAALVLHRCHTGATQVLH